MVHLPNFSWFIIPWKANEKYKGGSFQVKVISVTVRGLTQASLCRQDNKNMCVTLIPSPSLSLSYSLSHYLTIFPFFLLYTLESFLGRVPGEVVKQAKLNRGEKF